jgi:preprotein translocase subunit SecA
MLKKLLKYIFGDKQKKDVARLKPIVDEVNRIAEEYKSLSNQEVSFKTAEFRRLLHVPTRIGTAANGEMLLPFQAEEFALNHPDVKKAAFTTTRRDMFPSSLVAFIILKEGTKNPKDVAEQLRTGMGRLSPGYVPSKVFVVDEHPTFVEEGRTEIDYHQLQRVAEDDSMADYAETTWKELVAGLKPEEPAVTLNDILPDAFAAVKEASRRMCGQKWSAGGIEVAWNMVPFDVQIMGGIALVQQSVAEMGTGEGKTLTAISPLYFYALMAKGSHLVTVNDYLAKRDSEWNGPIFNFLGMGVSCIDKTEPHSLDRRVAYMADVTYGTNNEFGFDYLRDNMATDARSLVQRPLFFGIVDETDSVLIDEARTPLIIAGPVDRETHQYDRILPSIRDLVQKQNHLVNKLIKEAEDLLEKDNNSYEAGIKILQVYKGAPKHTRYMKLRQNPDAARLQDRAELDFMREKKIVQLESELYYVVDEKHRSVDMTEKGRVTLSPTKPETFVLIDIVDEFAKIDQKGLDHDAREKMRAEKMLEHDKRAEELHTINKLLEAYSLKAKDIDYVVEDNKVVIVDEYTGRKLSGRRWSDGLHQAVEAKEGVSIEKETQTLATVTVQNYFRMYKHLAGMTGTAETEAGEFMTTYKMDVVVVPPNKPTGRQDLDDVIFKTKREKYAAVLDEIERLQKLGLPVLVGTTSVQVSETLSRMLRGRKLEHEVLNAKNHLREAQIIQDAGKAGAITIATNMAGRGTDIKLGEGVDQDKKEEDGTLWPGGLQIIGTERHDSRRIDRQLRGRSGRQGDPGSSRFFLSLEDDLIMWFGGERIQRVMAFLGMKDGEAITHSRVTGAIEKAQKKVEMINQERRRRTLQFDNVLNEQRRTIYGIRRSLIIKDNIRDTMLSLFADAITNEFEAEYMVEKSLGDSDFDGFFEWVQKIIATEDLSSMKGKKNYDSVEAVVEDAMDFVVKAYDLKVELISERVATQLARQITLRTIDTNWIDHLLAIDDLREGVFLRSYGQRDPLLEYTRDATLMFKDLMLEVHKQSFDRFFRAQISLEGDQPANRVSRVVYAKPEVVETSQGMAEQARKQAPEGAGAPAE